MVAVAAISADHVCLQSSIVQQVIISGCRCFNCWALREWWHRDELYVMRLSASALGVSDKRSLCNWYLDLNKRWQSHGNINAAKKMKFNCSDFSSAWTIERTSIKKIWRFCEWLVRGILSMTAWLSSTRWWWLLGLNYCRTLSFFQFQWFLTQRYWGMVAINIKSSDAGALKSQVDW